MIQHFFCFLFFLNQNNSASFVIARAMSKFCVICILNCEKFNETFLLLKALRRRGNLFYHIRPSCARNRFSQIGLAIFHSNSACSAERVCLFKISVERPFHILFSPIFGFKKSTKSPKNQRQIRNNPRQTNVSPYATIVCRSFRTVRIAQDNVCELIKMSVVRSL